MQKDSRVESWFSVGSVVIAMFTVQEVIKNRVLPSTDFLIEFCFFVLFCLLCYCDGCGAHQAIRQLFLSENPHRVTKDHKRLLPCYTSGCPSWSPRAFKGKTFFSTENTAAVGLYFMCLIVELSEVLILRIFCLYLTTQKRSHSTPWNQTLASLSTMEDSNAPFLP